MQNLDNLFAIARTEAPCYTYQEAKEHINALPGGGFGFSKVTGIILGCLLLGGIMFLWLKPEETPITQNLVSVPTQIQPKETSISIVPEETRSPFVQIQEDEKPSQPNIERPEQSLPVFITPAAPKYEEKKKESLDYLVLTEDELQKLGIYAHTNEYLKYEIKNGRKNPCFALNINKSGYREVNIGDSLRESDLKVIKPSAALFVEISGDEVYHFQDGQNHTIIPKKVMECTDGGLPQRYISAAFEHSKTHLIPVLIELSGNGLNTSVTFYLLPTEQLRNAIPSDIDSRWKNLPDFSWAEYSRYRSLLQQREIDLQTEISKKASHLTSMLSQLKPLEDKKELKKLGINYNGKNIKVRVQYSRDGKPIRLLTDLRYSAGGTFILSVDTNATAPIISPAFISDSLFKQVQIMAFLSSNLPKENEDMRLVAISMADSLVPVIIPIRPSFREKLLHRVTSSIRLHTHRVFWYRKQDLERVGVGY